MDSILLNGKTFIKILPKQEINKIVQNLAQKINQDFADKNPVVITVLDGAFIFAADLVRLFDFEHEFCFVKLSSYEGLESKRQVSEIWSSPRNITGRNVLIIEDIVDTGHTMSYYKERLRKDGVKSISICSFLMKPTKLEVEDLGVEYVGIEISDEFVIGYGLDWDQKARHLPDIYQLEK